MSDPKRVKIIIDTNIWISYLIGKELGNLTELLANGTAEVVICDELVTELKSVLARPKIAKYVPAEESNEFISLLLIIATKFSIKTVKPICRDPKDDFILALGRQSGAKFLITGDKDLLALSGYGKLKIISAKEFRTILKFTN